jgi:hypothetical protein
MTKVIRLPNDTKLQSQMLNYILKVMDEKGEVVEAWQYEGYSGHAMWDVESDYKRLFPKEKGYTIDW